MYWWERWLPLEAHQHPAQCCYLQSSAAGGVCMRENRPGSNVCCSDCPTWFSWSLQEVRGQHMSCCRPPELCSNTRQKSSDETPAVVTPSMTMASQRPSVVPKTMCAHQLRCSLPEHEIHFTLAVAGSGTEYGHIQLKCVHYCHPRLRYVICYLSLSLSRFCPICEIPGSEDKTAALHTCGEGEWRVAQKSLLLQGF